MWTSISVMSSQRYLRTCNHVCVCTVMRGKNALTPSPFIATMTQVVIFKQCTICSFTQCPPVGNVPFANSAVALEKTHMTLNITARNVCTRLHNIHMELYVKLTKVCFLHSFLFEEQFLMPKT